jgi:hypothetical protein
MISEAGATPWEVSAWSEAVHESRVTSVEKKPKSDTGHRLHPQTARIASVSSDRSALALRARDGVSDRQAG